MANVTVSIPLELVEQIRRSNALVFVGDRIACADGHCSELGEWTVKLSQRCGLGAPAGLQVRPDVWASQRREPNGVFCQHVRGRQEPR